MLALSFLMCFSISAPAVFFFEHIVRQVWFFHGLYIDVSYHQHLFVSHVGCAPGSTDLTHISVDLIFRASLCDSSC